MDSDKRGPEVVLRDDLNDLDRFAAANARIRPHDDREVEKRCQDLEDVWARSFERSCVQELATRPYNEPAIREKYDELRTGLALALDAIRTSERPDLTFTMGLREARQADLVERDDAPKDWRRDLRSELLAFVARYTREQYPASLETQRDYQQGLFHLEQKYTDRLDHEFSGARKEYDANYRSSEIAKLQQSERDFQQRPRSREDLFAMRAGMNELHAYLDPETGAYRSSQPFRDGMQALTARQADEREAMTKAFQQTEDALNDRFGFAREYELTRKSERSRGR